MAPASAGAFFGLGEAMTKKRIAFELLHSFIADLGGVTRW